MKALLQSFENFDINVFKDKKFIDSLRHNMSVYYNKEEIQKIWDNPSINKIIDPINITSKDKIMSEDKNKDKQEELKSEEFLDDDPVPTEEEEKALQEKIKNIRKRDPFVYR